MSKQIKIEQADDDLHQELMEVMDAYLKEQECHEYFIRLTQNQSLMNDVERLQSDD